MKTNLKLATTSDPPRSPEREALAEAIDRRDAAQAHLPRLQAAIENTVQLLHDAMDALDGAEQELKKAKASESRHLSAVALGEVTEDMSQIKIAERAVADAQARCDTARHTRIALEQEARATEAEIEKARLYAVEPAIREVIKSEAPVEKLLADFAAVRRDYVMRRRVLEWLASNGEIKLPSGINDEPHEWTAAREPWDAAVSALATDPDAPLPTG